MIAIILQVILALPKIFSMIKDLIAMWSNMQTDSRIKRAKEALDKLENAKSQEERDAAAKDVINNGPI